MEKCPRCNRPLNDVDYSMYKFERTRKTDPVSSMEAEQRVIPNAVKQHRKAFALVQAMPGSTAIQLAEESKGTILEMTQSQLSRRLPELRVINMVTNDIGDGVEYSEPTAKHSRMLKWYPT